MLPLVGLKASSENNLIDVVLIRTDRIAIASRDKGAPDILRSCGLRGIEVGKIAKDLRFGAVNGWG